MWTCVNPFTPKSDLIDFTLSNARQFYSSKLDPSGVKGLTLKCLSLTDNYYKQINGMAVGTKMGPSFL